MPVVLGIDPIDFLPEQRSIDTSDRLFVLSGGHVVGELIEILLLGRPVGAVQASRSDGFSFRKTLAQVLLSPIRLVPASLQKRKRLNDFLQKKLDHRIQLYPFCPFVPLA